MRKRGKNCLTIIYIFDNYSSNQIRNIEGKTGKRKGIKITIIKNKKGTQKERSKLED